MPIHKKLALTTSTIAGLLLPALAKAQTSFSIESVGSTLGLGGADLKTTTIHILNLALGFMALIAVAMIIVSGIIAATSSDEDRAATAKRVITGAIIGLVIVLVSWAIVIFSVRTTQNVAQ